MSLPLPTTTLAPPATFPATPATPSSASASASPSPSPPRRFVPLSPLGGLYPVLDLSGMEDSFGTVVNGPVSQAHSIIEAGMDAAPIRASLDAQHASVSAHTDALLSSLDALTGAPLPPPSDDPEDALADAVFVPINALLNADGAGYDPMCATPEPQVDSVLESAGSEGDLADRLNQAAARWGPGSPLGAFFASLAGVWDAGSRTPEAGRTLHSVLDTLSELQTPDLAALDAARQASQNAHTDALSFEILRESQDWSEELASREKTVYDAVQEAQDTLRELTVPLMDALTPLQNQILAALAPALDTLTSYVESASTRVKTDAAAYETSLSAEKDVHASLRSALDHALEENASEKQALQTELDETKAEIEALVAKAKALQSQLTTVAHERAILQTGLSVLDSEHEINVDLASSKFEAVKEAKDVVDAQQEAVTSALASFSSLKAHLAKELPAQAAESLYLSALLHSSLYVYVSMQIFVCEARIQMLGQQQEALRVRKQRANLAQDIDAITACNAKYVAIQQQMSTFSSRMIEHQNSREVIFSSYLATRDAIEDLAPPDAHALLASLDHEWTSILDTLKALEQTQHSQIELDDVLDAASM